MQAFLEALEKIDALALQGYNSTKQEHRRDNSMVCKSCGEFMSGIESVCSACGTWNSPRQSGDSHVTQQGVHADHSASMGQADYLTEFKRLSKSTFFVLGCLLITIGTLGGIFFNLTWQNILGIAFATIHLAALWMLVFEASSNTDYSKTLNALTMFKVSAVISMILSGIIFGASVLVLLLVTMPGFFFLITIAIVGGIGYLIIKYYFLALLKVLDGIKQRITTGNYAPLEGLGSFLVLSYISIGFSILIAFTGMVGIFDLHNLVNLPPSVFLWRTMLIFANSIGMLLCLRTLKRFE